MASLKAFFKSNLPKAEQRKVFISDRFCDENGKVVYWTIEPVTAEMEKKISDSVITERRDKRTGSITQIRDDAEYMARLSASAVVFPDLGDKELQADWKAGSKVELLRKMLTVGELVRLAEEVSKVSGLDLDEESVSEMEAEIEYAKNE